MRFLPKLKKAEKTEAEARAQQAEAQRALAGNALSQAVRELKSVIAAKEAPE
ncbi:hypothetical protein JI664_22640 [Rhodobacter sp. NTK016B]|uniref:hypothetical protein n=1 Tax=Rhodobacter sp. NTK016B TaxID=2759676 RepID=UPI001A8EDE5C|nr:hypothetical protein [Rhodobacter sp. NTK016B]MBN8294786.1 hypothetical protein [Rhodobacter sp. NTK016B]